jgi:mannose-1-phosphate guanylyltransferase
VRRRRDAAAAGLARKSAEAVPAIVRAAIDFQETVRRVSDPALFGRPVVVTNAQYRFPVAEQLAAIGAQADILLEPAPRDSGRSDLRDEKRRTAKSKSMQSRVVGHHHLVTVVCDP